ncbi:hypothetical protein BGX27_003534 [Mortierella sp. AM989]|nr:hypothetical protein BGX27_003534 [Mortierella sp. AM989]
MTVQGPYYAVPSTFTTTSDAGTVFGCYNRNSSTIHATGTCQPHINFDTRLVSANVLADALSTGLPSLSPSRSGYSTGRMTSGKRTLPPVNKSESQGLSSIRCPDHSSGPTLKEGGNNRRKPTITSSSSSQPKELKSILKKPRSTQTSRRQVHRHLEPTSQYMHLNHYQQYPKFQQQQIQQHHTQQYNHGSGLSQKNSQQSISYTTSVKSPQGRSTGTRPLPTPPTTKHVRWATYNEVLEIDNIDDLIMMGYYDDYDSDLGWNYRDESQEYSSSEDDEETKEMEEVRTRASSIDEVVLGDNGAHQGQEYLQHYKHQSQTPSIASSDSGFDSGSESSLMDEESEIAEDDLIERFSSMDGFFTSMASSLSPYHPTGHQKQDANRQHRHLGSSDREDIDHNNNYRSDDTLPLMNPSQSSRPSSHVTTLTPAMPTATESSEHCLQPPRLKSPPPPHSKHSLSLNAMLFFGKDQETQPTETKQRSEKIPEGSSVLKSKAPRLDRNKILAEVAARKQNSIGSFARRASIIVK